MPWPWIAVGGVSKLLTTGFEGWCASNVLSVKIVKDIEFQIGIAVKSLHPFHL